MDNIEAEIISDDVVSTHFPSSVNGNIAKHGDDKALNYAASDGKL